MTATCGFSCPVSLIDLSCLVISPSLTRALCRDTCVLTDGPACSSRLYDYPCTVTSGAPVSLALTPPSLWQARPADGDAAELLSDLDAAVSRVCSLVAPLAADDRHSVVETVRALADAVTRLRAENKQKTVSGEPR